MGAPAFTSALLRASADGLAGLAAARVVESATRPEVAAEFEAWRTHLRQQILALAAAVEDEAPERFAARVGWSRDAFAARQVSAEGVGLALGCLEAVLEESLPAEARAPLPPHFERAREELARGAALAPSELQGRDAHERLAIEYLEALEAGDEAGATALVLEALDARRLSVREAITVVLAPAQRELGRRWHQGAYNVAEEHFATQVTRKVLARVLARTPPAPHRQRSVVIAAVAGDAHDLGLSFVAAFFELEGWRVLYLGADTPIVDLVAYVTRHRVDLVALGATLDSQRPATAQAITALRAARPDQRVLVGGAAFAGRAELWRRAGADGHAASPEDAVRVAGELFG